MKTISLISITLILTLFACHNKVEQTTNTSIEELTDETPVEKPENQELFRQIKEKDSLLFQIGFNRIDTFQVASLLAADFEFYHDEHGITDSKADFIGSIESIRDLPFKTWRVLIEGSMEVFPLYKENNQVLYGVIQNGAHEFYQQKGEEDARKTSTARFTHLWIMENRDWKLKRVFSYDHTAPEQ